MKLLRAVIFGLIAAIVGLSFSSPFAYGQNSDQKEKALKLIEDAADKLCQSVPIEQTSSGSDLTAEGKAQVNGLIGKIADLGISGSAQRSTNHSRGVLQKDLASAIAESDQCRLSVLRILQPALLATNSDEGERSSPAVTPAPRAKVNIVAQSRLADVEPTELKYDGREPLSMTPLLALKNESESRAINLTGKMWYVVNDSNVCDHRSEVPVTAVVEAGQSVTFSGPALWGCLPQVADEEDMEATIRKIQHGHVDMSVDGYIVYIDQSTGISRKLPFKYRYLPDVTARHDTWTGSFDYQPEPMITK